MSPCCGVMVRQWAGQDSSKLSPRPELLRMWTCRVVAVTSAKKSKYHRFIKTPQKMYARTAVTKRLHRLECTQSRKPFSNCQTTLRQNGDVKFLFTHSWWGPWAPAGPGGRTRSPALLSSLHPPSPYPLWKRHPLNRGHTTMSNAKTDTNQKAWTRLTNSTAIQWSAVGVLRPLKYWSLPDMKRLN